MGSHEVTVFRPYEFQVGQKIRIEGGPRVGDWEVVGVGEKKISLRCPVSGRQFEWAHFCYYLEDRKQAEWPRKDDG